MVAFTEDEVERLIRSGEVAARVRELGASLVKPGASARDVCVRLEEYTVEQGGRPAFPCNFSVNEVAAHYTPGIRDDLRLTGVEVVKIDIGVSIDGYIADTAVTVDLSGVYGGLLEAARDALMEVVKAVKPDISVYEIGRIVESTIKRHGYKPVKNLTGHTIGRWLIHAGTTIPNYADRASYHVRLRPGTLAAVEPFATNGRGIVKDGGTVNIYSYTGRRGKYDLTDREKIVLDYIVEEYRTQPFTPRWLLTRFSEETVLESIRSLAAKGVLHAYPVLIEASRGMVSQFEHTFLILKDRVIVTTCPDCM